MELRSYWELLRKWLWLIALTTVLAAMVAFLVSSHQTPIYEAKTRLLITEGSSDSTDLFGGNVKVTSTFAQVLASRSILEKAANRIGLEGVDIDALAGYVSVQPVRDTHLIDLRVQLPSPEIAAALANALPQVLAEFYKEQQSARFANSKRLLQEELTQLGDQLGRLEAQYKSLQGESGAEAESNRSLLQIQLTQLRSAYSSTLGQLEEVELAEAKASKTVTVVDRAKPPQRPVRPRVLMNALLAAIVGGMLGLGVAFLIEYLDDSIKTPDDIARITPLSTLGIIARRKNGENHGFVTLDEPRSPIAEAYRTIRTSIQFAGVDKSVRTIVITSAGLGEGKSTTAANLAVVMAQAGSKVALIDADLRKPTQHKRWGVPNTVGLTGALLMDDYSENLDYLLTPTSVENLWLLTSGQLPHNPSELLGSHKLRQLTERLLQSYDMLIFDSPPALAVTDPVVLGREMDGVIVVVDSGITREPALVHVLNEMERVQAHIIGIVLNRFSSRSQSGYYYYYYERYYRDDESGKPDGSGRNRSRQHRKSLHGKSWLSRQFSRLAR